MFFQFCKHFFPKPYNICDRISMRRIIDFLWQLIELPILNQIKSIEHIKMWAYGLSIPINPSRILLHKLIIQDDYSALCRAIKKNNKQNIFINVNEADALGITPIMLCAMLGRQKIIKKLIKAQSNPYLCPLTIIKKTKTVKINEKLHFILKFPQKDRKQPNTFELLLNQKKILRNLHLMLYEREIKHLYRNQELLQQLSNIPDCSFQILWQIQRGILNFQICPCDIITIYKKDNKLRIDYHLKGLQLSRCRQHYSLLFKQENKQKKYYYINHNKKQITNLFKEVHDQIINQRFQQYLKMGNIMQQEIINCQGNFKKEKKKDKINKKQNNFEMNFYCNFMNQNIENLINYKINNINQYQQQIMKSQIINYELLDRSERKTLLEQKIGSTPKIKSKIIKSDLILNIQWLSQTKLKLKHLQTILKYTCNQSILLDKITKILQLIQKQSLFEKHNLFNKIPCKAKINLEDGSKLEVAIKNICYDRIDNAVFQTQWHAKQFSYFQRMDQKVDNSLLNSQIVSQQCSINMEYFLNNTQKLTNLDDEKARQKFKELQKQIIISEEDEQQNKQKQIPFINLIQDDK